MKQFFSVKEFAKLTGIADSTLRFWDEIDLFSPVRRDPDNNYRQYSLAQLTMVNFISIMSNLNYPLKQIAEIRKNRDPESLMRLLELKEKEMDMELRALRERSSVIHARRELIRYGLNVDVTQVAVMERDDMTLIIWPRNEYQEGETFLEPLAAFVNQAADHRINLDFPVGGYWDSLESFQNAPSCPDCFFSVDPTGTQKRAAGQYLVGFTLGDYGDMGDLPERMVAYAKENNVAVDGPVYVTYLHDEISTLDPARYLAQACVAVPKRRRL